MSKQGTEAIAASDSSRLPGKLRDKIFACSGAINRFLAPPFDATSGKELVELIRSTTRCDAVSLFLSKQDPSCVDYVAGIGYTAPYTRTKYYLADDKMYLTAFVYKTHRSVNLRHDEIEGDLGIRTVVRAGFYVVGDRATNIIAVPIMASPDRCYGVLKLENKEAALADSNGRFPGEDLEFAGILATMLGTAFQQRLYGKVAIDSELPVFDPSRKTLRAQLEAIAEMLRRQIRSECASVFVRKHNEKGEEVLQCEAGVGYFQDYDMVYAWNDSSSFTVHVASAKRPLRYTEEELMAERTRNTRFPFTGRCSSWIRSGRFRNVLGIPILSGDKALGVLKLENKLPGSETFNECDESFCDAFAQGPIRNLLLKSGPIQEAQTSTRGYRLLLEKLGQTTGSDLKKPREMGAEIQRVRLVQQRTPDAITGQDCAIYLGISRATYYRELRSLESRLKGARHPSSKKP